MHIRPCGDALLLFWSDLQCLQFLGWAGCWFSPAPTILPMPRKQKFNNNVHSLGWVVFVVMCCALIVRWHLKLCGKRNKKLSKLLGFFHNKGKIKVTIVTGQSTTAWWHCDAGVASRLNVLIFDFTQDRCQGNLALFCLATLLVFCNHCF